jgi:hypothetical protein
MKMNAVITLWESCSQIVRPQEESSEWATAMTIYWLHQLRTVSVGKSIKIRTKYSWQSIIQKSADVTHTPAMIHLGKELARLLLFLVFGAPFRNLRYNSARCVCVCALARLSVLCAGSAPCGTGSKSVLAGFSISFMMPSSVFIYLYL